MATRRRTTVIATVSALPSPAHRWPHLASSTDTDGAAGRVLSSVLTMKPDGALRFGAAVPAGVDAPEERFEAAVALYERNRWIPAYEMLSRLADRGDAPASKLALLMLRYGAPLYGTRFAARPEQIARWARQVLEATAASAATGSLEKAA
jgi:hypothetical protein